MGYALEPQMIETRLLLLLQAWLGWKVLKEENNRVDPASKAKNEKQCAAKSRNGSHRRGNKSTK